MIFDPEMSEWDNPDSGRLSAGSIHASGANPGN